MRADSSNLRCEPCLAGGTFKSRCGFPHIHIWHETSSTSTTMRGKFTSAGKSGNPIPGLCEGYDTGDHPNYAPSPLKAIPGPNPLGRIVPAVEPVHGLVIFAQGYLIPGQSRSAEYSIEAAWYLGFELFYTSSIWNLGLGYKSFWSVKSLSRDIFGP